MVIKERKAVMEDLKNIYQAANVDQAENALAELSNKWKDKYPYMVKSWQTNWIRLSAFYKYPKEVRRIMYTTNIIESFNSQLRKVTKSKRVFTNDDALLKLLYLVFMNIKTGWTGTVNGWKLISSQLIIIFEDRMNQH